jgi:hypothetical protein
MGMKEIERAILWELIEVSKNKKLKIKDIMEWSTGEIKPQEGEVLHYLPVLKIYCCIKGEVKP